MASNELIALQKLIYEKKLTIKQDIELKTAKLLRLEKTIIGYAEKYHLWKPRYKTIDDLYLTVKEAKRWQRDDFGLIQTLYLQWRLGPKSRNDEIRPDLEKRNALKEEIEELKMRRDLLEKRLSPIPAYFIDAGMAEQEAGYDRYVLTTDAREVIRWFFFNNSEMDMTELYFQKHFITMKHEQLDIETVKRYFRDERRMANYHKKHPEQNLEKLKQLMTN